MKDKLVHSLQEAIRLSGLKDGDSISFHHHLRNGDYVVNMVLEEIKKAGIKDLTVNMSSFFDCHAPIIAHIKAGVVSKIRTNYMAAGIGRAISQGILAAPVEFRTHGGRPSAIEQGLTPIDVAFLAAPTCDSMGNLTGKTGPTACGSLGYAFPDAMHAKTVIAVTDNLVPYPLLSPSIPETYVDYVVQADKIGDPSGIVSGTTRITRDPVGLMMAEEAARVIQASGLLKNGFSFQTGAGGASLATASFVRQIMRDEKIKGSFCSGGITGYMVDMLKEGLFDALLDVQCFDLKAASSLAENPRHMEISASRYASPTAKSAVVDSLDVVVLGATEVDTDFNVNVHTNSSGYIMGGSGGHSDTAAGAKMSLIITPLFRGRMPMITDRVHCISTPGKDVDLVVTQAGIAVNPKNKDLLDRLLAAGLPVTDIHELKEKAEKITGKPKKIPHGDQVVADVIYRDGRKIDRIYSVLP